VVLTVLRSFLRQSCLVFINVTSALEVFLDVMRYINPRFTYLLTLLTSDIAGSARSLPTRSSAAVSAQMTHAGHATAARRRSHVAILRSHPSTSAVIMPPQSVSVAGPAASGTGPVRSHTAAQWLSPDNNAAGSWRTVPAEMTSYTTSSRHFRSPEVSVDVCDVSSLSDLDVQLETLNR